MVSLQCLDSSAKESRQLGLTTFHQHWPCWRTSSVIKLLKDMKARGKLSLCGPSIRSAGSAHATCSTCSSNTKRSLVRSVSFFLILHCLPTLSGTEHIRDEPQQRNLIETCHTLFLSAVQVYDYCVRNKLVDPALIAKWKKPGYERLCSTYVINTKNYKFGTVSICRVPKHSLGADTIVEDPVTGCLGCASGPGGQRNIFGNKYGE